MNATLQTHYYASPIGLLLMQGTNETLHRLQLAKAEKAHSSTPLSTDVYPLTNPDFSFNVPPRPSIAPPRQDILPPFAKATIAWLNAYFTHQSLPPLPPLSLNGTPFQQAVWKAAMTLPLGSTTTYGQLALQVATQLHRPHPATRAVGNALGANPLLLIVPCHRIIASHGRLGGFTAGLARKIYLLRHEAVTSTIPSLFEDEMITGEYPVFQCTNHLSYTES